ncbi:hypothetical protein ABOM_011330 [Aspergillus bombycis]|uniref:Uncharacterized protein n=1 Tax=Aspergillus bombycis TaxID=109264 RepID=A0A1F7ZKE6_9EURO|nr:hypothetical protein ABOM_011330 [Aspergillus bombycis]OGM39912.1 hypothetical protein ABOM_011330 [Aspergillus bombycis]
MHTPTQEAMGHISEEPSSNTAFQTTYMYTTSSSSIGDAYRTAQCKRAATQSTIPRATNLDEPSGNKRAQSILGIRRPFSENHKSDKSRRCPGRLQDISLAGLERHPANGLPARPGVDIASIVRQYASGLPPRAQAHVRTHTPPIPPSQTSPGFIPSRWRFVRPIARTDPSTAPVCTNTVAIG